MKIIVLGSAAGGGFPQWNCNCRNCAGVRHGRIRAQPRTQSSIAVSVNGEDWVLINASPDLLAQLRQTPALYPRHGLRDTPIVGIVLVDAQIDHCTGLFMLREGRPLDLWCTVPVAEDLYHGNPILAVLGHYCGVAVNRLESNPPQPFSIPTAAGLRFTPVALPSAAPPFSPHRHDPHPGDNIGLFIEDTVNGGTLFYAPGLGAITPAVEAMFAASDVLLVDGTFWRDDEMIALGLSDKTARAIGHLPQSGPGGMIEALARHPSTRRILIHINNTNPILDEDSPERQQLHAAGIEVAHDGMAITPGEPQ